MLPSFSASSIHSHSLAVGQAMICVHTNVCKLMHLYRNFKFNQDFVLSVWEERKVRLYGEHANVHSQNDSGDLRGVAGGDGELGCLCGKAGTSHLCDGSAHSSGCVVNCYGCLLIQFYCAMGLLRSLGLFLGTCDGVLQCSP